MSYWSNRKEYHEELDSFKSTNGAYKVYKSTSGASDSSTGAQVIQFIGANPTSTKRAIKNVSIAGKIQVKGGCTFAPADVLNVEFIKDINNAMSILVNINGQVSLQTDGHFLTPIVKTYMDKYKSAIDYSKQSLYSPSKVSTASATSASFGSDAIVEFSAPLIHPFFFRELGGINQLQITLFVDNSLFSLMKISQNGSATMSNITVTANIIECYLTYEEFDIDSDDFSIEIPFFQILPKENTSQSDVQNITGFPMKSFVLYAENGALFNKVNPTLSSRTLAFGKTGLTIDINNNSNVYNTSSSFANVYARCKSFGYKGEFSDFSSNSLVQNEFSEVICIDNKYIPYNLQTPDIYRFSVSNAMFVQPTGSSGDYVSNYHPTLAVVHYYRALIHLSPDVNEYKYYKNDDFVNISDGNNDDDEIVGGGWLSSLGRMAGKFIKNGGISKLANTVSGVASMIPGAKAQNVSNISGLVGDIGQNLGLSASVF